MPKSKYKYKIMDTRDMSIVGAKRVSVRLILLEKYTKEQIQEIIIEITNKYKTNSDIIWLYISEDEDKFEYSDFLCRSQWYINKIDSRYIPSSIYGENVDMNDKDKTSVEIKWNREVE